MQKALPSFCTDISLKHFDAKEFCDCQWLIGTLAAYSWNEIFNQDMCVYITFVISHFRYINEKLMTNSFLQNVSGDDKSPNTRVISWHWRLKETQDHDRSLSNR